MFGAKIVAVNVVTISPLRTFFAYSDILHDIESDFNEKYDIIGIMWVNLG